MVKRCSDFSPSRLGLALPLGLVSELESLMTLPLGQSYYSNTLVVFHMAHFHWDAASALNQPGSSYTEPVDLPRLPLKALLS